MRKVGLSDLDMAVRALLVMPSATWPVSARALIERAHAADVWRKRTGSAHPGGGTGSLYAQAALGICATSSECSPRYCAALLVVLEALADWRKRDSAERGA